MMPTSNSITYQLVAWLAAVAVVCYLLNNIWNITTQASSLSAIPNAHFSAPYSRLWLLYLKATETEHHARERAHRRLGPIIQIAPKELSVNCIENGVKTIYSGGFEKGEWYKGFVNYGKSFLFGIGPNKLHAERKRMLFPMFSNSYVQTSSEVTKILDTILLERLIPQMKMWALNQSVVDIHRENKAAMMDITTAYLFGLGNQTNFLLDPKEKNKLTLFEQAVSALFWMTELPTLVKLCYLLRIPLLSTEVLTSFQSIETMVAEVCDRTKQSLLETKKPHTSLYAQLQEKLEPTLAGPDLDPSVAAEMMDNIQAGHEGPAITVTYVMCELSRNFEVLSRLRLELSSLDAHPTAQDIESLPFLDAVLLETLRRYPAALGPFPRNVPLKGSNLGGFDIPGGTIVSASIYCLHNNSAVFPNPERWLPDRWIAASAEQRKSMNKWLWAFGTGSRMCIGSHLAIRMMKTFIVAVYSEFDTVIVPETSFKQTYGLIGAPVDNKVMLGIRKQM